MVCVHRLCVGEIACRSLLERGRHDRKKDETRRTEAVLLTGQVNEMIGDAYEDRRRWRAGVEAVCWNG